MPDVREMFREAWSQALAGVNAAEQEAEKVLTRLAGVAGLSAEDVKRHAREFGDRLSSQRREIEKSIDEAARRAAGRFRIPSRDDIEKLERRLDAVTERIEALSREGERQEEGGGGK